MASQLGKMAKVGGFVIPLMLTACAGGSGNVVKMDERTYMVVSSSRWQGNMGVAATGLKQADTYCKDLGRQMVMTGAETSDGFIGVMPPKAVIMFRCDPVRGNSAVTTSTVGGAAISGGVTVAPMAPATAPMTPTIGQP